jgi:hypothetical protein
MRLVVHRLEGDDVFSEETEALLRDRGRLLSKKDERDSLEEEADNMEEELLPLL